MKTIQDVAIITPQSDEIAIAKENIEAGSHFVNGQGIIEVKNCILKGHPFALSDIKEKEFVTQYGHPFGQSLGIKQGELISTDNVKSILPGCNLENYVEPDPLVFKKEFKDKSFLGYPRKNGTVGTRNYFLVIPTSMCVSDLSVQVAQEIENRKELLESYENIDGIRSIPHTEGCGCASNEQIDRLLLVIKGYVTHSNVGGVLILDLGCEQTNYDRVYHYIQSELDQNLKPIDWITVQENGGTKPTIDKSISLILGRLPEVNDAIERQNSPVANLIVGAECGASDSFSGITANPVIGNVIDKVILGGGSGIFSEIPEMVGTFDMLLPRFRNLQVAKKFNKVMEWYVELAKKLGLTLQDNLVPKNKEGGLMNSYIKSLGAVLKGGTMLIEDILEYAEPIKRNGLHIMQGPGGDPESVTGLVASGCNVVCFSTGYGAITGNAICPVIKISSNQTTARNLPQDIDFNAGRLLEKHFDIDTMGSELLQKVISVASGDLTWSERWEQRQFQVWTAGKLSL